MTEYTFASEAKQIAEVLIPKHHPHLDRRRIDYLFQDKEKRKGTATILGFTKLPGALEMFYAARNSNLQPLAFVIVFPLPTWQDMTLSQRIAVVDHELEHCKIAREEKDDQVIERLYLKSHDIEEFTEILKRRGPYHDSLRRFVAEAKQLELPGVGETGRHAITFDTLPAETAAASLKQAAASVPTAPATTAAKPTGASKLKLERMGSEKRA